MNESMQMSESEVINETIHILNKQGLHEADAALVSGTGLGGFEGQFDELWHAIPYTDLPAFPTSTVQGHEGMLYYGKLGQRRIVFLSGRFHYYEGYTMQEIARPVRVLRRLGIQDLFVSNVSGSTNAALNQGDFVVIQDHINFMPDNPLRGPNLQEYGPRFPDFSQVYDPELRNLAMSTADALGIELKEGVYFCLAGPNLETPAEYRMIHRLGGDLVGMSTVPEVIVAKHAGMRICAISLVVNKCFPLEEIEETTLETVIEVAAKKSPIMQKLFAGIIENSHH